LASGAGAWCVVVVARAASQASQSRETFHRNVGGFAAAYNKISNRNKHRRPQQTSSLSLSAIYCCALLLLPAGYFLFFIVQQQA
jgi:hypothetical protein